MHFAVVFWLLYPLGKTSVEAVSLSLFFFNVFLFIERERKRVGGEGQGERETQSPNQAPHSELSAQSLMWGSNA